MRAVTKLALTLASSEPHPTGLAANIRARFCSTVRSSYGTPGATSTGGVSTLAAAASFSSTVTCAMFASNSALDSAVAPRSNQCHARFR